LQHCHVEAVDHWGLVESSLTRVLFKKRQIEKTSLHLFELVETGLRVESGWLF